MLFARSHYPVFWFVTLDINRIDYKKAIFELIGAVVVFVIWISGTHAESGAWRHTVWVPGMSRRQLGGGVRIYDLPDLHPMVVKTFLVGTWARPVHIYLSIHHSIMLQSRLLYSIHVWRTPTICMACWKMRNGIFSVDDTITETIY